MDLGQFFPDEAASGFSCFAGVDCVMSSCSCASNNFGEAHEMTIRAQIKIAYVRCGFFILPSQLSFTLLSAATW